MSLIKASRTQFNFYEVDNNMCFIKIPQKMAREKIMMLIEINLKMVENKVNFKIVNNMLPNNLTRKL